ncbi:Major sperm protein isoform beta [Trichinella murrelli]|uniref:Major sperm protein n=1 Tax=Trichinella murrelli TaxID=144512 RepID=A0A0V0T7Z1_9BILA|nr:Major sperm protein isoform beta [Trichinella murrelli]
MADIPVLCLVPPCGLVARSRPRFSPAVSFELGGKGGFIAAVRRLPQLDLQLATPPSSNGCYNAMKSQRQHALKNRGGKIVPTWNILAPCLTSLHLLSLHVDIFKYKIKKGVSHYSAKHSDISGAHDVLLQPGLRVSFNAPFTTRQQTMMRLHNKSEKPIMWVVKSNLGKKITISPSSGVLEPNSAVNIHLVLFPFNYSKGPEERLTIETAVILPLMEKKFDQDFLQICEILNRIPISIHYNL